MMDHGFTPSYHANQTPTKERPNSWAPQWVFVGGYLEFDRRICAL
ncbi:MAG: hypothetical protein WA215_11735 [Candidatus Cybelea sp.]